MRVSYSTSLMPRWLATPCPALLWIACCCVRLPCYRRSSLSSANHHLPRPPVPGRNCEQAAQGANAAFCRWGKRYKWAAVGAIAACSLGYEFGGYAGCVPFRLLEVWGPTGLARWPGSAGRCRHAHSSSGWEVVYTYRHIYKLPRYSCHGGIGQKRAENGCVSQPFSSDAEPLNLPLTKLTAVIRSILLPIYPVSERTPKMT